MEENVSRQIDIQGDNRRKVRKGSPKKFHNYMQKKLVVLFLIVLLAFVGLSIRLIYINKTDGEQYQKQVLSQQQYDSTTLPYKRGDIVDAKGTPLAISTKVYNLVIDSKIILGKTEYLEPTMQALQDNFELDMTAVREYVTTHPDSSYYVPLKKLTYEEISGFKEAEQEDSNIAGIWFEEEYKRYYPNGTLASELVGFTIADNQGNGGLEEYYNDILNGTTGREYGYLGEGSSLERTIKPAVDGYTLHSTIDVNIQSIVEKHLLEFQNTYKDNVREGNGANSLGCIIMDVNNGEILAMSSYPNYDLNNPYDLTAFYSEEQIAQIESEGKTQETLNQIWRNFCISDTYEPGSTAKPFTVAMALESGVITGNEVYQCDGSLEIGGHTIKCHNVYGDGAVTVQDSIAWSCNVALMKIGQALGNQIFTEFQQVFNFGLKTNLDIAGEARTAGLLYTEDNMKAADLATNTFGQNFNVTMIQMISGFSSLVNGGYYYEPHLVNKISNSSGAVVQNIEPRLLKQTVSESTSELVRQYCRAVVMEEGGDKRTGRTARPAGYAIGGKTGTAQTLPRGNGEYIVSFIGYAPADDPQIAIYVVVDRPNVEVQDKATYATGLVRDILTEVLPYMNIFMTEELTEAELQELEEKQLTNTTHLSEDSQETTETTESTGTTQLTETTEEGGDFGNTESGEGTSNQPAWMDFPIDAETGYRIDPNTGEFLDPNTGDTINTPNEALSE